MVHIPGSDFKEDLAGAVIIKSREQTDTPIAAAPASNPSPAVVAVVSNPAAVTTVVGMASSFKFGRGRTVIKTSGPLGTIIGIVIGLIVLGAIIAGGVCWYIKKKKAEKAKVEQFK